MSLNVYLMGVGILELLHTHNANNKNKGSQMGHNKKKMFKKVKVSSKNNV